jgi:hypothetical protein
MNTFKSYHILFCFLLLSFISCQKQADSPVEESQGTNFNKLLKTVAKNVYGISGNTYTTSYKYNPNDQLAEILFMQSNASGNTSTQTDTYYRTAGGRLDSIVYNVISNPPGTSYHNYYKTDFHYTAGGTIDYTVNRSYTSYSDSCIYSYQGNQLVQRIQYRKPSPTSAYLLLVTFNYTYDAAGNLISLHSLWTNITGAKNFTYSYDNKPAPLPVLQYENELFGFWTKAFDNTFKNANNIISRRSNVAGDWEWSEMDFEYNYSANNKPLYQKARHAGSPLFYEVYYYYD